MRELGLEPRHLDARPLDLILLSMFVGLEVELEVGLELGAIAAELAAVGVTSYLLPLGLREAPAHAAVVEQQLQAVCAEGLAHEASEHLQGWAVVWGRRGRQPVGQGAQKLTLRQVGIRGGAAGGYGTETG